jgi:DNA-binding NarL/FixJ family response regulator
METLSPVTVVLVDSQELILQAVARLLSSAGLRVVAEAHSGEDGIRMVGELRPDVVIAGLILRGMSGIEMVERLSVLAPTSPVLVLTNSADPPDVIEAILAGASGYVLKDAPPDEIVAAARATAAGDCAISSHVAGCLFARIREREIAVTARSEDASATIRALLTAREFEIFKRLPSGKTNHEIGSELSLSGNTVKNHIASILDKLDLDNRIQAAVQAVRHGFS